jgi:AmmeMemoRadiSam system protein A
MTDIDKQILLSTARESIEVWLFKRPPRYPSPTPELSKPCGAFVTLKCGDDLRGCIGHIIASKPLIETVREVAVESAFKDPRFPEMTIARWNGTKIEISVLSPFQHITDLNTIQVGIHGVMIRKSGRSAIYLPQVAIEQRWDRDTMLSNLCRKAGLPSDAWKAPDAWFETHTAIVFGETNA